MDTSTLRHNPMFMSGGGGAQSTNEMARSVELLPGGNAASTGRKHSTASTCGVEEALPSKLDTSKSK